MSITGCYVLHLYCDDVAHKRVGTWLTGVEFTGSTSREARSKARQVGWVLTKRRAYCKLCAKRRGHGAGTGA